MPHPLRNFVRISAAGRSRGSGVIGGPSAATLYGVLAITFKMVLLVKVEGFARREARQCFSKEMHDSVTFELMPSCNLKGLRNFKYSFEPGNYSCRAFDGRQLTIPGFDEEDVCDLSCPDGHYIGLGPSPPASPPQVPPDNGGGTGTREKSGGAQRYDHRLSGRTRSDSRHGHANTGDRTGEIRDYTETQGALRAHELTCKECPENTFSIAGGKLIHRWLPEITGELPEDVAHSEGGSLDSTDEPEGALPPEFTSRCFGFNSTAFQLTNSMMQAWVEGHLCEPWTPESHGLHISSGNSQRGTPKVRSELHLRLRMVLTTHIWHIYWY